ncbi:MAG: VCBS repeat-containing protein, partial [bacterium]
MSHFKAQIGIGLAILISCVCGAVPAHGASFAKIVIDASADFECAGIGDIDGDGKNEIVSGSYWYDYPSLERHFICDIEAKSGYRDDFSNLLVDVDNDGDMDIVSVTWFTQRCLWRENPGSVDGAWIEHEIDKPGNIETGYLADLTGDGLPDLVSDVAQSVTWYERLKEPPYWRRRSPGKEGVFHGLGSGDVNGDGRLDIITPKGWYEAPENPQDDPWAWHPDFELGSTSVPILGFDVDGDG